MCVLKLNADLFQLPLQKTEEQTVRLGHCLSFVGTAFLACPRKMSSPFSYPGNSVRCPHTHTLLRPLLCETAVKAVHPVCTSIQISEHVSKHISMSYVMLMTSNSRRAESVDRKRRGRRRDWFSSEFRRSIRLLWSVLKCFCKISLTVTNTITQLQELRDR